jgi:hypothetical protein
METLKNAPTYFAVEQIPDEDAQKVSHLVLQCAQTTGTMFLRLESMDLLIIGSTELIRFRTDAKDVSRILAFLWGQGRAIVSANGSNYVFRKKNRQGPIPSIRMLAPPCQTHRQAVYLGTACEYWQEQFADPSIDPA